MCIVDIQDFFSAGARTKAENQGHSSIELEMYKQYYGWIFEARNVQNCEIMICTRSVLQIKEYWALNLQTVYGWIAREARHKFWS